MKRTDVFVHFGHSPMKDTDKVIYVPLFSNVEVTPIMEESLDTSSPPRRPRASASSRRLQHMNRYEEMTAFSRSTATRSRAVAATSG